MIPEPKAALEGEVVAAALVADPELFKRESGRLWRESAEAVGIDPLLITDIVRRVTLDPWSSLSDLPRYVDKPAPRTQVPTPRALAQRINGKKEK